jgi:BON domain
MASPTPRSAALLLALQLLAAGAHAQATAPAPTASAPAERRNWFDDPFLAATTGLPGCPVPDPPLMTEAEMQHDTHWRAERGTSCFRSGRCRLPNAYLYDKEIAPRVVQAIKVAGTFDDTSVWVEGQRRWVWLKGCVSTAAQAAELERMVRLIDDVEAVIPQLIVGTTMPVGAPVYRLPP